MKLISWNVNGIRAAQKKGFIDWMQERTDMDVVCIQETKAHLEQLDDELVNIEGYKSEWFSAEKKGYSSVSTYSKEHNYEVVKGFGNHFDAEGRVLRHDFKDFTLFNIYFPNGQRGDDRLMYKMDFYEYCLELWEGLRKEGKKLVICGDYNTAHHEIDLARPKENSKTSGFLPIEREWMDRLEAAGYIDTFRMFHKQPEEYSWWNMRTRARERNVGWRIDYFFVSEELKDNVKDAFIWQDVHGSDHCPVGIDLEF